MHPKSAAHNWWHRGWCTEYPHEKNAWRETKISWRRSGSTLTGIPDPTWRDFLAFSKRPYQSHDEDPDPPWRGSRSALTRNQNLMTRIPIRPDEDLDPHWRETKISWRGSRSAMTRSGLGFQYIMTAPRESHDRIPIRHDQIRRRPAIAMTGSSIPMTRSSILLTESPIMTTSWSGTLQFPWQMAASRLPHSTPVVRQKIMLFLHDAWLRPSNLDQGNLTRRFRSIVIKYQTPRRELGKKCNKWIAIICLLSVA